MHSENGYGTVLGMWSFLNLSGTRGTDPSLLRFRPPLFRPPARTPYGGSPTTP
jgi:hypothetical protein